MFYGMNGQELLGTWESAEDAVDGLLRMAWKQSEHVYFRIAYGSEFHSNGASVSVIQTGTEPDGSKIIEAVWHDSDDGPKIDYWRIAEVRGVFIAHPI